MKCIDELPIKEQIELTWKYLNDIGIYTEEQLDEAYKKAQLDIGIFTMPYKKKIKFL